ncbi:MAG: GNAT family N-acetyltransferase [Sphingomonadales bacterium]
MGDAEQLIARVVHGIDAIDADQWDACSGPGSIFTSHAFLSALEASGSAAPATGWAPYHIVLEQPGGGIVGAVPLYLKGHSYGEYVFDHAWSNAYERAGGRYYPKLQSAVPFTPVTGPRLLTVPGPGVTAIKATLGRACIEIAERLNLSSLHFTFPTRDDWDFLGENGFLLRTDQQFHWTNMDYSSFDDFLGTLSSRKRKAIRRERRGALADGMVIETLTGDAITERHWDEFFAFYLDTGARKWGHPYLNREFFNLIGQTLADRTVLIRCLADGRAIAGALNFIGGDTLYGRYWGCLEDHRFLHFEACYYHAIDYAIDHGLAGVEAGAQGSHKLARGYLPRRTYSAHWIRDPNFRTAVRDFLRQERRMVESDMGQLARFAPFRRGDGG